jgi:anti-sigma28 factor (negative regulator of flagellin synthesis)
MSGINGVGANTPLHNVSKVQPQTVNKSIPANAPKALPLTDKVQLSHVTQMMATLKAGGDIRADKVASIRAQLDAGTYETEAKLDQAIDRLIDDLGR